MEENEHEYETIGENQPLETDSCGCKGWEDWCRQDRVDAVGWGVFFIWAALVLAAGITGYSDGFSWWNGWAVLFVGAGVITLVGALVRLALPQYRRKWMEGLIGGLILLAIGHGLGGWISWDWNWIWVLVLVIVGLSIVTRAFARRR